MKNTNQTSRKECWKAIAGSTTHEVSNRGKVRNIKTGELLNACKNKSTGYMQVGLYNPITKRTTTFYVHRLVA